jgi:hypothetical protein
VAPQPAQPTDAASGAPHVSGASRLILSGGLTEIYLCHVTCSCQASEDGNARLGATCPPHGAVGSTNCGSSWITALWRSLVAPAIVRWRSARTSSPMRRGRRCRAGWYGCCCWVVGVWAAAAWRMGERDARSWMCTVWQPRTATIHRRRARGRWTAARSAHNYEPVDLHKTTAYPCIQHVIIDVMCTFGV